jgi:hypothetical protein
LTSQDRNKKDAKYKNDITKNITPAWAEKCALLDKRIVEKIQNANCFNRSGKIQRGVGESAALVGSAASQTEIRIFPFLKKIIPRILVFELAI